MNPEIRLSTEKDKITPTLEKAYRDATFGE